MKTFSHKTFGKRNIARFPQDFAGAKKKNFQTYKPSIAVAALRMFWISVAITLSFILSNVYLLFAR